MVSMQALLKIIKLYVINIRARNVEDHIAGHYNEVHALISYSCDIECHLVMEHTVKML